MASGWTFETINVVRIGAGCLGSCAESGSPDQFCFQSLEEAFNHRVAVRPLRIVGAGVLVNLLNPKLTVFFLAFMPQFVDVAAVNATADMLGLASVFMAVTFAVFVAYGLLAAQARDHVISRPNVLRLVKRSFASAFGLMGLRLALAER
jgi:threonine/homoserine/homoserine lactone efflux protein